MKIKNYANVLFFSLLNLLKAQLAFATKLNDKKPFTRLLQSLMEAQFLCLTTRPFSLSIERKLQLSSQDTSKKKSGKKMKFRCSSCLLM